MQKMKRQGDVLVTPVDSIPPGSSPELTENGLVILAKGEATGHHHSVDAAVAGMVAVDGLRFLSIREIAPLRHQEHAEIRLPAGNYEVRIQREYDPTVISRVVAD